MKEIKIFTIILILFLCFSFLLEENKNYYNSFYLLESVFAETKTSLNNSTIQTKILNVLTIRIDPWLNSKSERASDYLASFDTSFLYRNYTTLVNEYVSNFNYISNEKVNINIVGEELLNEFPTYNETVTRSDGSNTYYNLDEETWLEMMENGWYGYWETDIGMNLPNDFGDFNYNYLINTFNLIERKNNNEFDMVWLCDLNESGVYESVIVGKSGYWDNGETFYANCENFQIMTLTLPRSETYLECLGHSAEYTLQRVFEDNWNISIPTISTQTEFDNLNTWDKFSQYNLKSNGFSVAGNVHFSPNSNEDYQWENTDYVYSSWYDFKYNYPNLTNEKQLVNKTTWSGLSTWDYMNNLSHKKWWFSIMPHVAGRDSQGFSNNWWDYLTELDWATSISDNSDIYHCSAGSTISNVSYNITYNSGDTATYYLNKISANTKIISGSEFVEIDANGNLKGISQGFVQIRTYFDNKYADSYIQIDNNFTIAYNNNTGQGSLDPEFVTSSDEITTQSSGFTKEGFTLVSWKVGNTSTYLDLNTTYSVPYLVNITDAISDGTIVLYANWEANSFNIIFNANGADGFMNILTTTNDIDVTLPKNNYSLLGKYFCGWATISEGEIVYSDEQIIDSETINVIFSTVGQNGTYDLFAVWENIFNGGDGSSASPFEINNSTQLFSLSEIVNDISTNPIYGPLHYVLVDNINLNGANTENWTSWNYDTPNLTSWIPIGDYQSGNSFRGTFNGNGFQISGIYIANNTFMYQGLFGFVSSDDIENLARIINVRTTKGYINVDGFVGGILGYNNEGIIENCHNSMRIIGSGNIGGIVGYNFGQFAKTYNCYNTGIIQGSTNCGAIVGNNSAAVENCYWLTGSAALGIGYQSGWTESVNCLEFSLEFTFVNGNTSDFVNQDKTYSFTKLYDALNAPILFNLLAPNTYMYWTRTAQPSLTSSTPTFKVSLNDQSPTTPSNISQFFFMYNGSYYLDEAGTTTFTQISMLPTKEGSTFGGYYSLASDTGEETQIIDNTGIINPSLSTLTLKDFTVNAVWDTAPSGLGTEENPFTISNLEELIQMQTYINSYNSTIIEGTLTYGKAFYKLTANIEMNDETFTFNIDTGLIRVTDGVNTAYIGTGIKGDPSGLNTSFDTTPSLSGVFYINQTGTLGSYGGTLNTWTPMGNLTYTFSGNFDGNNFVISGLYINDIALSNQGLFGVNLMGTISNTKLTNTCVIGLNRVGSLVGANGQDLLGGARVENCSNNGIVVGKGAVGGIVGQIRYSAEVFNSSNSGYVMTYHDGIDASMEDSVGGIAGYLYNWGSSIENCFNTSTIIANGNSLLVGGIIGNFNEVGPLIDYGYCFENCYNIGTIISTGTDCYIGSLAGRVVVGAANKCFWLIGTATLPFGQNSGLNCYSFNQNQTLSGNVQIDGIDYNNLYNVLNAWVAFSPSEEYLYWTLHSTLNDGFPTITTNSAYTITFDSETCYVSPYKVIVTYGSDMPVLTINTTTRLYYNNFNGIYDAVSNGEQYYTNTGVGLKTWDKTSDVTLYGQWTGDTYTIIYDADSITVLSTTIIYGEYFSSTNLPDVVNLGYTFNGWYTHKNDDDMRTQITTATLFTIDIPFSTINHINKILTLFADFSANTYTIIYETNTDSILDSTTIVYGDVFSSANLPDILNFGYTFDGWFTKNNDDDTAILITTDTTFTIDLQFSIINHTTQTLTIFAHFTGYTYTITYETNTDNTIDTTQINYGNTFSLINLPEINNLGYTFNGWYTQNNNDDMGTLITTDTIFTIDIPFSTINHTTHTLTLFADYTANVYTIFYDANSDNVVDTTTIIFGESFLPINLPEINDLGYTFNGWYTQNNNDDMGTLVTTDTIFTAEISFSTINHTTQTLTLFADFAANVYTIFYDTSNDTIIDSTTITYNENFSLANLPEINNLGYAFNGWYTQNNNDDMGTLITTDTIFTAEIPFSTINHTTQTLTLFADFSVKVYTIFYDTSNDTVVDSTTITYKENFSLANLPEINDLGYTFNGWYTQNNSEDTGTLITTDTIFTVEIPFSTINHTTQTLTLFADFTANIYTIFYDTSNDTVVDSTTIIYNENFSLANLPEINNLGYTFNGWYPQNNSEDTGTLINTDTIFTAEIPFSTINHTTQTLTLFADFTANRYLLTLDNNYSQDTNTTLEVVFDSPIGDLPNLERTGYNFINWEIDGVEILSETIWTFAENKTAIANWEIKIYNIKFYDELGTNLLYEINVEYLTVVDLTQFSDSKATENNLRYDFIGWYDTLENGNRIETITATENINLFSRFDVILEWSMTQKITFCLVVITVSICILSYITYSIIISIKAGKINNSKKRKLIVNKLKSFEEQIAREKEKNKKNNK
ncbi:MAG: InlB B-repeat-containing protein [Clostridia bacterium]|nr:InlB B-repeat-containing protein [Clostridia bacterium]